MSMKEFWEDDPDLFWAYRFSYFEKVNMEQESYNHRAWLQGVYFYDALVVALTNAFSKSKIYYPKMPYGAVENKVPLEEKRKAELEIQVADIRARIKQVNKIKSSITADKGNIEGGGNING